jgi:hypothetical protein
MPLKRRLENMNMVRYTKEELNESSKTNVENPTFSCKEVNL